ncbi:MAG: ubiquinone biosynthesis regulatory protein kinase UbiB [Gammaproteobacteria bacterium]|nr:MAG: ubiquinone biosynthesis regulatory protein kinase UbiB [Gammaproteobacteria bacterium]
MVNLNQFRRLLRIHRVFVKHDLDELIAAIHFFRPYRILLRAIPWRWRSRDKVSRGARLRQALEELGPIFVKFGQMLSVRPDLTPEDIAQELTKLQDQVPAFAGDQAVDIIEQSYGDVLGQHFRKFDREPVASASVAQVHFAELLDGTEVAVKVLRPGIEQVIERDLELLYALARLAMRYWADARRLRLVEVIDEFSKSIHDELDLVQEAANASQLRANFADSDMLYVAKVFWDHTRRNVMVMERIHGIPVSDIDALRAAGIDMRKLAYDGVEIFFTQAFRDGFFHADMHPGNIFVSPEGQYRAVDFGIMGSLGETDKRYLAQNFLAFFNRDYRAVAEAHLRAGWVPAETRPEEFEAAIRAVCEPIFAKPIKDISFGRLLLHLFQTARRFNMEVQPQLVLLQKTLFQIEGLGRQLYPDLDLWVTAKPYLERWMSEQLGPRALIKTLRKEIPKWWQIMPELPGILHEILEQERSGQRIQHWRSQDVEALQASLQNSQKSLYLAIAGGSLSIAAAIFLGLGAQPSSINVWLVGAGIVCAGAGGLMVFLAGLRRKLTDKAA